jgi:hypothetical protein
MNILTFIFRPSLSRISIIGWILVLLGLVLFVFIIGIPLLALGWLILLYDMFRSWYFALVPQKQREELVSNIKKEYQPYQPAIQSMKSLIFEMLKTAAFVFISGILLIIIGFKFK